MALSFALHVNSLIRFAQVMAERLAMGLGPRLGIGRFGHAAFLPRAEFAALAAEIGFLEALTRRALFLIAAVKGVLAPLAARAAAPSSQGKGAMPASRRPCGPCFRLTEAGKVSARKEAASLHPAQKEWQAPPRSGVAGMLPTRSLVRRYRALVSVFEDPLPYITRMRRLIAVAPRRLLPPGRIGPHPGPFIVPSNHRILLAMQANVEGAALRLDTG